MVKPILTAILISLLMVLCLFRPFFPGRYDPLAVTISFMAQVFGYGSMILFVYGLIWWMAKSINGHSKALNRRFAKGALIISAVLLLMVAVVPFSQNNTSFGIIYLLLTLYITVRWLVKFERGNISDNILTSIPVYLIFIPTVVVTARVLFIEKAVAYSRKTAIANSEMLIRAIEDFYNNNGYYPVSLHALHPDVHPGVVGIAQYGYEPNGKAYNIYFRQFSEEPDVEEIVLYNKLDQHHFAAHALDILQYTGEALALRHGDRRRVPLPAAHWIAIKFE
jgi:hypothetical protein